MYFDVKLLIVIEEATTISDAYFSTNDAPLVEFSEDTDWSTEVAELDEDDKSDICVGSLVSESDELESLSIFELDIVEEELDIEDCSEFELVMFEEIEEEFVADDCSDGSISLVTSEVL